MKMKKKRLRTSTLVGLPFDAQGSYLRRAAPSKILKAQNSDASNHSIELGMDLGAPGAFEDLGDLSFRDGDACENCRIKDSLAC